MKKDEDDTLPKHNKTSENHENPTQLTPAENIENKGIQKMEISRSKITKIITIILAISCCGYAVVRISRPLLLQFAHYILRSEKDQDYDPSNSRITVEAEKVVSSVMPKYINTIGELKANASVIIHSEINGCIKEVAFVEGSSVSKGDLLIRIDDEQFQAELRSYKAQLQAANAEFERISQMRNRGVGSGREYDKALAEMNIAKSKVEMAEAQLKKTEIRAPFDGTIGIIDVGVGTFVQTNQELVTLVDQTPIKVKFGVPGKFVNDVGIGQSVELKVDAAKNRVFKGTVEAVDSHVDPATNSVWLRASVPNEDGILKAGLFSNVTLVIGEQSDTITVDESAVERIGEQEFVWVVERGKARRTGVLTGVRDRGRIEVVAGLKPEQIVVVSGQLRLSEGTWVKVINLDNEEQSDEKDAEKTEDASKKDDATSSQSESAPSDSDAE